jgi:hypothetical protein
MDMAAIYTKNPIDLSAAFYEILGGSLELENSLK